MTYLIFSDVHGNLPALEKVIAHEKDTEGYIHLGDAVNYGPWSNECVELIDSLENCINVKGNHEDYFELKSCRVQNELVQKFYESTIDDFKHFDIIKNYKERVAFHDFELVHNLDHHSYVFVDTDVQIDSNKIIGHSHQQYERIVNDKKLLNPGSIGQNRKEINLSNYALWNLEKNTFELKEIEHDIELLINEMVSKKYPIDCINYYKNKL